MSSKSRAQAEAQSNFGSMVKQEIIQTKLRVDNLEKTIAQMQSANTSSGTGTSEITATQAPLEYKPNGQINVEKSSQNIKLLNHETRQLTLAVRGYVMLAKEAHILGNDQIQTYQNLMNIVRMAYQAQRAIDHLDRLMNISMASNPVGWAIAAVSFGGRLSATLAYSARTSGTSGV